MSIAGSETAASRRGERVRYLVRVSMVKGSESALNRLCGLFRGSQLVGKAQGKKKPPEAEAGGGLVVGRAEA